MEDVGGFSGTSWWMVRRPELPEDLKVGAVKEGDDKLLSKAQKNVIEHLLAQDSLQLSSSQLIFEPMNDFTCRVTANPNEAREAMASKALALFATVETLVEEPGSWRFYHNQDNHEALSYSTLIYLSKSGQLLGMVSGFTLPSPSPSKA